MSIEVALSDLADEVTRRGPGYLLTTTVGGRPHVMHVRFDVEADPGADATPVLRVGVGRTATANIAAEAQVTMLWPPLRADGHADAAGAADEHDHYSLIADGVAEVDDGRATITPTWAVLHRPA